MLPSIGSIMTNDDESRVKMLDCPEDCWWLQQRKEGWQFDELGVIIGWVRKKKQQSQFTSHSMYDRKNCGKKEFVLRAESVHSGSMGQQQCSEHAEGNRDFAANSPDFLGVPVYFREYNHLKLFPWLKILCFVN